MLKLKVEQADKQKSLIAELLAEIVLFPSRAHGGDVELFELIYCHASRRGKLVLRLVLDVVHQPVRFFARQLVHIDIGQHDSLRRLVEQAAQFEVDCLLLVGGKFGHVDLLLERGLIFENEVGSVDL